MRSTLPYAATFDPPSLSVPVEGMVRVHGQAVAAQAVAVAAGLALLGVPVVVLGTEAAPRGAIPELGAVSAMACAMVDVAGRAEAAGFGACRVSAQVRFPGSPPPGIVAALCC